MELGSFEFEKIIKKKLKTNQLLLAMSVLLAVAVFMMNSNNVYWAMIFVGIGALGLPNINKCKKDLIDYKHGILGTTEGKVLDVFAEVEGRDEGNWIVFLDVPNEKDIKEFIVPQKPDFEKETNIKIYHTKTMAIPVRIVTSTENIA